MSERHVYPYNRVATQQKTIPMVVGGKMVVAAAAAADLLLFSLCQVFDTVQTRLRRRRLGGGGGCGGRGGGGRKSVESLSGFFFFFFWGICCVSITKPKPFCVSSYERSLADFAADFSLFLAIATHRVLESLL